MKRLPQTGRIAMTTLALAAILLAAGQAQAQAPQAARSAASTSRTARQAQPAAVRVQRANQARPTPRPTAVTAQRNPAIPNAANHATRQAQPAPVSVQRATPARPIAQAPPRPIAQATPRPIAQAAPRPIAQAAPRPIAQATPRPIAQAAPRPIAQAAPRPSTSVSVNINLQRATPTPVVIAPPAPVVMPAPVVTMPQQGYGYASPIHIVASSGVVFRGELSTKSEIAPRTVAVGDGIEIRVRKVRRNPFRADLEIRVGGFQETYKRLPAGSRISLHGWSGQLYHIDVVDVGYHARAVTIVLSR